MSDVTGPISTLPGAAYAVGGDGMCDFHPGRPAVTRIQGETDSFGSEMHDLCDECAAEFRKPRDTSGRCDWCKTNAPKLWNRRDYDEGLYGPVYLVCDPCIKRDDKKLKEELDRYEWESDDWD